MMCNRIARQIWDWCIHRNIWVSAAYLTSQDNFLADEQSRISHSNAEWEINPDIFSAMCNLWETPEIDLFASRLNFKVKQYYSWKPDPFSTGVDAFTANWGEYFSYIFPPFSLVGKILQKLEEDQATAMVIVPMWTTQSWFGKLIRMLIDCPFYFNRSIHTVTHPHKETEQLPKMRLLACCLSGKDSLKIDFQKKLSRSYCPHGGRAPLFSMKSTLNDLPSLQLRGVAVPIVYTPCEYADIIFNWTVSVWAKPQ